MAQSPTTIPPSTTTAATATSNQTGGRPPFGGSISARSRCTRPSTSSCHVSSRRVMAWRLTRGASSSGSSSCAGRRRAADEHGDDGLAGGERGGDLSAHVVAGLTEARARARPLERRPVGSDDDDGRVGRRQCAEDRALEVHTRGDAADVLEYVAGAEARRQTVTEASGAAGGVVPPIADEHPHHRPRGDRRRATGIAAYGVRVRQGDLETPSRPALASVQDASGTRKAPDARCSPPPRRQATRPP